MMMKKCCVLLSLLFLLTGCGKQPPVDRPHTLAVGHGESSVYAKTSGYSWNWKDGRQTVSAEADEEDPRALLGELPWLSAGADTQLVLNFAEAPQEVTVTRWSSADNYAVSETVDCPELVLEAPQDENSYLYSVAAAWSEGGRNWGSCIYNFTFVPQGTVIAQGGAEVDFSEVVADLTLPQILQLKPADLFGIEMRQYQGEGSVKTCRNLKDKSAILDFLQTNLSADMQPVEAAPAVQYLLRLACVDGRQVTLGYAESGGAGLVFVGETAYETQSVDFGSLWDALGASGVSRTAAAMGSEYLASAEEIPIDQWDADIVYGYVRGLADTLVYDEVRWIEDPQEENGYRLDPGWKDQEKAVADGCEFWLWDRQANAYGQVGKDSFGAKTLNSGYDILMRFYVQDDAVIAACQQILP